MDIDSSKKTVYVSNLVLEACHNEDLIHAAFIPFGEIMSLNIALDPQTNEPLGYAHIEYLDPTDCPHVI